ncbi:hypothetical protein [Fodinicola feengrottensis]|uniref:hypothetical protein n=1 Tax=Fodinicola feengrottensis TaxID=435914 RepID=UPI0024411735|nr:hypothetical protein [Fodinicola feengrottensis]
MTGAVLLIVMGIALAWLPVPYVAELPGPTVNTLGSVGGKKITRWTAGRRGRSAVTST